MNLNPLRWTGFSNAFHEQNSLRAAYWSDITTGVNYGAWRTLNWTAELGVSGNCGGSQSGWFTKH